MKIALIGTSYPYRGGIADYNIRLAQQFQVEGHEVESFNFTVQYPNFLFPGKTQFSSEEAPKGLKITRNINSVNPLSWKGSGRQIAKGNFDLVIVRYWLPFFGPCFGTILRQIKKRSNAKVICIADNIIPHEKRKGDRIFTNYFVKPVDGFVAMSKTVLKDLDQFDKNKPRVFSPHPVYDNFGSIFSREEALKKLNVDEGNRYMLFFGLIRDYKGLDLLIEAYADQRFRERNIKLIVAGEYYSNEEKYKALIKEKGLEQEIILNNTFIPTSEVENYFNASDVVVQPYKSATQSGITQIAYHFNKPMIVTNVGGLTEMCPDGKVGFVVERDSKQLADAIIRYFDEDRKAEMTKNVEAEKAQYSWNIMTSRILELAHSL